MKYKKGDRVKVREDLHETHGSDMWYPVESMLQYAGKEAVITGVNVGFYSISVDLGEFGWTDEMFSGLADEPTQSEPIRPEPDRTMIAAMAMQGLIANTPNDKQELIFWLETCISSCGNITIKEAYAKEAVMLADALITELNKPKL